MAKFMFIDDENGSEVLGIAEGRNEREAMKALIRKNPWLSDRGFDDISAFQLADGSSSGMDEDYEDALGNGKQAGIRKTLLAAVALVLFAIIVWAIASGFVTPAFTSGTTATRPVVKTVNFKNVQSDTLGRDINVILEKSKKKAAAFLAQELDKWGAGLTKKSENFTAWYCGYFTQQTLALQGVYGAVKGWTIGGTDAAKEISDTVKTEFSARVIQPETAQNQINTIAEATVNEYFKAVTTGFQELSFRYQIPLHDWEGGINDVSAMTARTNVNRGVPLTIKAITGLSVISTIRITEKLMPMIESAGEMILSKTLASFGRKAMAGLAGEALGVYTGVGLLAWDAYDHYTLKKTTMPLIKKNIEDYLETLKGKVAAEVMVIIDNAAMEISSSKVKLVSELHRGGM
ncbi:MAG TPA: hypothetical protein PKK26_16905 [Candidatus Wallbacteria bacterium]|nr:hypothetical protein [Candidatus Wallbacteria bacterium]